MDWMSPLGFDAYVATGLAPPAPFPLAPHVAAARLAALGNLVKSGSEQEAVVDLYRRSWRRLRPSHEWMYDTGWEAEWPSEEQTGAEWSVIHPDGKDARSTEREGQVPAGPSPQDNDAAAGTTGRTPVESPAPQILELKVNGGQVKGLDRAWEFYKGDPDPYPSLPHGHEMRGGRTLNHPKLDAYRGWIFNADGTTTGRESRKAIVALWNDDKFRQFAHDSLVHVLTSDPTLQRRFLDERGIRDPLLLPGERG